eukprot:3579406-Prymnesium_polylepis.1
MSLRGPNSHRKQAARDAKSGLNAPSRADPNRAPFTHVRFATALPHGATGNLRRGIPSKQRQWRMGPAAGVAVGGVPTAKRDPGRRAQLAAAGGPHGTSPAAHSPEGGVPPRACHPPAG